MTRTRAVVVLCLSAALALTACGAPQAAPSVPAAAGIFDGVDAELVALEAAGLVEEEAAPAPSASADKRERVRPRAIRKHLRKNTLHGEVTVETKEGTRTVVVQRGRITAVSDTGITVESTDGFDLTWTYGDPLRLVQDRKAAERSALKTGVEVGVGGLREGDTTRARLIVVK